MQSILPEQTSRRPKLLFGLSPWLVVGLCAILGLAIVFLTVRSGRRTESDMIANYRNRADALIWALEAGTRTWLGMQSDVRLLQPLVVETARQPGIVYIAVADPDGTIVAHSNPNRIGQRLANPPPPGWENTNATGWRSLEEDGERIFEAYGLFAPLDEFHHNKRMGGHHGHGMRMGRRRMMQREEQAPNTSRSHVFVGLDQTVFNQLLREERDRALVTALAVAALGLGGLLSLFWTHHYRRSRRLLMDARALASEVVSSLPLALMTSAPDRTVRIANATASGLLSPDGTPLAGHSLAHLPGLDWNTEADKVDHTGKALEKETDLVMPDGRHVAVSLGVSRIVSEDGVGLGHLFIFRDIGPEKRLQAEVERNRRLTALGNLAAGVAHEIRNPLSSIKGIATYLASKAPAGGREEEAAKTMIGEVNRLNSVVSELLEFSRPGTVQLAHTDINRLILHSLRLAEADARAKNISIEFTPRPVDPVPANQERLTQALLNLYLNAIQAMDQHGVLTIAASGSPDTNTVSLTISDTGHGMTDEVRASIFIPYFTTKPSGTGLGLAIVHQIVEAHGGAIAVSTRPEGGTAFTITLPLSGNKAT